VAIANVQVELKERPCIDGKTKAGDVAALGGLFEGHSKQMLK
jgi:hypothetical protein